MFNFIKRLFGKKTYHAWYGNGTSNGSDTYYEYAGEFESKEEALGVDIGYGSAASQDPDAIVDGRSIDGAEIATRNSRRGWRLGRD